MANFSFESIRQNGYLVKFIRSFSVDLQQYFFDNYNQIANKQNMNSRAVNDEYECDFKICKGCNELKSQLLHPHPQKGQFFLFNPSLPWLPNMSLGRRN